MKYYKTTSQSRNQYDWNLMKHHTKINCFSRNNDISCTRALITLKWYYDWLFQCFYHKFRHKVGYKSLKSLCFVCSSFIMQIRIMNRLLVVTINAKMLEDWMEMKMKSLKVTHLLFIKSLRSASRCALEMRRRVDLKRIVFMIHKNIFLG